MEGNGAGSNEEGVSEGYGASKGVRQGLVKASDLGEGEPWLLLAMFGHTYYPLLIFNLFVSHSSLSDRARCDRIGEPPEATG